MKLSNFGARNPRILGLIEGKRSLAFSSSLGALAWALSPSSAHAQTTTDSETATTEVVAIEGQELDDGRVLGGFLPVVIGGEGDLLFLSQTANNSLITFDGNLDVVANARPFGLQNLSFPVYSIDSQGDAFAITTINGIVTGSVSDSIGSLISFGSSFDGSIAQDQGNLGEGARPIILGGQTALLLSNVGVSEADGSFIGNTLNFALFAGAGDSEFEQISSFLATPGAQTSLNFAGTNGLLASFSNLLTSPNSAQTSNLFRLDITGGVGGVSDQIGPNGNPQIVNGAFASGDGDFAGFTFFNPGVFGGGANFGAREFSANSTDTVFVLGNASLDINGGPGDDLPGELLVLNDVVIADTQSAVTSLGSVNFLDFNDVLLAENGDIFFTSREARDANGLVLEDAVGLWRIINPGQPDQLIVPVLSEGDALPLSASDLQGLFPNSSPPTSAQIVGFSTGNIAISQGITTDGRPQLLSVNGQGHIATIVQIDSANGPVEAIVAQDNNGNFNIVAFIGQTIDVSGQGDLRRITNFTAQFGSNDVDGAGDLFNLDEQLGFIVTLDDPNTTTQEFSRAVLRVSLNGIMTTPITNFLFQGDCGDNFFGTLCQVGGEEGSNFVNADDLTQIADFVPGTDGAEANVQIIGADIAVSGIDVTLTMIDSDSTLVIENGANFEVTAGGTIETLIVDANSFTTGGTLMVDSLVTADGAEFTNIGTTLAADATIAGDVTGNGLFVATDIAIEENSVGEVNFDNELLANSLTINEDVSFARTFNIENGIVANNASDVVLSNGGMAESFTADGGSLTNEAGIFAVDELAVSNGVITANSEIRVRDGLMIDGGTIAGDATIIANSRDQDNEEINHTLAGSIQIDGTLNLALESETQAIGTQINFGQDGTIRVDGGADFFGANINFAGAGKLEVEGNGSLILEGNNTLENLLVNDALDLRSFELDGAAVSIGSGTTSVRNLTLQNDEISGRLARADTTGLLIGSGGVLNIDLGGRALVQDYLIAEDVDGALLPAEFNLLTGSSLEIVENATFENRVGLVGRSDGGADNLEGGFFVTSATIVGDGLFFNSGITVLRNSTVESLVVTQDGFDGSPLQPSAFIFDSAQGANVVRTNDAAARGSLNLADEILTTDNISIVRGGTAPPVPLVSAAFDETTFQNGRTQILPDTIDGGGSGIILDDIVLNNAQLEIATSTILAPGFSQVVLDESSTITLTAPNGQSPSLFLTGDPFFESRFVGTEFGSVPTLQGAGRVFFNNATIAVVQRSSITDINDDNFFDRAVLVNELGSVRSDILQNLQVSTESLINSDQGFLQLEGSDLDDVAIGNQGFLRLSQSQHSSFSRVFAIENRRNGWLSLSGEISFVGESADDALPQSILNADLARIQLDGATDINGVVRNLGFLVASQGSGVSNIERLDIAPNEMPNAARTVAVFSDSQLNIGSSNALFISDSDADILNSEADPFAVSIAGRWLVDGGLVNIFDGNNNAPDISVIEEGARVEIINGGMLNNLGSNGIGLDSIAGTFIADGIEGDDLDIDGSAVLNDDIGIDGDLTGDGDIAADNIQVGGDANLDGSLTLRGTDANPSDGALSSSQIGGDLNVGENAVLIGLTDITVDGSIGTQLGGQFLVDGVVVAGADLTLDGVTQTSALGGGGDVTFGDDATITGTDDLGSSFGLLISGDFSSVNFAEVQVDEGKADLVAGGNLTVGPLVDVDVDGGTLVSADFEIGADASFDSTGFFAGFGDFSSASGSQTTVQGSAIVDGSANVGGSTSFGQLVIGEDAEFDEEGVYQHGFGDFELPVSGEGEIDFSVPLDVARSGAEDLADAIGDDGLNAALDDGSFGFSPGNFAFGAFGDVAIGEGATFISDGDAFTGGSLDNAGDAFFNGDLLTAFESDQPGNALENGEGAQLIVSGSLGVAGNFQNSGRISVEDDIIASGSFNNDGSGELEFGGRIVLRDDANLLNSGILIGGRSEPGVDLEQFNIRASLVTNGGFLGGAGTIEGDFLQQVQQDTAGLPTISPGFSPGIINITGDAVFEDGVIFFEIAGLTPGTEHDQINVGGNLTIGENAMVVVDLLELADGSGIFLPQTGDEIVLFTASDITPDDVEQIDFAVLDELPLGFTLVPDISITDTGEVFRVLRGFNGSQLAMLSGLDPAQAAVAGALDFLSTAESGVPSPEIFQLAVDLQFTDDAGTQFGSLTALSASTLSAIQDSAMRAGSIGLRFAERRIRAHAEGIGSIGSEAASQSSQFGTASSNGLQTAESLKKEELAALIAQRASQGGGTEFLAGNGSVLRIVGSTSYLFGDSASRAGAVGFDYDGWSANAAIEFEGADGGLLLGGALSLGNIDADLDNGLGNVDTDSFAATLYGQYTTGPFSIALGYSIADLDLESQREVLGASAIDQADGQVQHFFSSLSVRFVETENWKIGPEVSLSHSDLEIDALAETGAGTFNLITSAIDRDTTLASLSGELLHEFEADDWSGAFSFGAGYQLALSGDQFTTNATAFSSAPGTSFANPVRPLQNDGFALSSGLEMRAPSRLRIGLHYDGLFAENAQDAHELSFAVSLQF